MSLFHQHRCVETQRVFTGPSGLTSVERWCGSIEEFQQMLWGITTILLRCTSCGAHRTTKILGDARKPSVLPKQGVPEGLADWLGLYGAGRAEK